MSFSVQDKVALVTGANRGIGKSIVETLLKNGAKLRLSRTYRERLHSRLLGVRGESAAL